MAYFIDVPKFSDNNGSLCVVENLLPFEVKRIYYMFDVTEKRGGHRHKITQQALICLSGHCEVYVNNGSTETIYKLNRSNKCLILNPEDWHTMDNFSKSSTASLCISLFLSSAVVLSLKYFVFFLI